MGKKGLKSSLESAIIWTVHKSFYASGFLYHVRSQQILLHQPDQKKAAQPIWSLLSGEGKKKEPAEVAFKRIAYELLKLKIEPDKIYPVYDYFHNTHKKIHYVFYAEISKLQSFGPSKKGTLSWFSFKETFKLPFSDQTKQDIVVAERVIKAKARSKDPASKLTHSPKHLSL